jgi:predicted Fe-Mo cluster-binding NifX family protein
MMKIAVLTDDGKTISRHFGRAHYYQVFTIEDGKITGQEMREKMGHRHFADQHHQEEPGQPHGMDAASHQKHISMTRTIDDCEAVIGGGMGMGAFNSLQSLGIKVIMTDMTDVEAVIQAYLDGTLVDRSELLH